MSISNSYPTQRPSLNLVFNGGSDQLDSRISFSRADTPPTYAAPSAVHYWSNEKHLSSENLITQSQFSGWTELTSPTVTAAYTNGPDGSSNTATRLQSAPGADRYFYSTETSWTSGQQYTVSCWVKSNTGVAQTFAFFLPTTPYASANLTTHATDWTRITATFTAATSSIYCGFKLLSANTTDLSIWGFQVNTGANALDYQATTSQIHRSYSSTLKSVANAGDPRFEYSPADGQSDAGTAKGLLIEAQSTSLVTYSEDSTQWINAYSAFQTNAGVSPDGTITATLWTPDATTNPHYMSNGTFSATSGTTYTGSVFLKGVNRTRAQLTFGGGGFAGGYVNFSLTGDGSVLTEQAGATGTISSCGNGWYRVTMTDTADATVSTTGATLGLISSDTEARLQTSTPNGYDGLLVTGFQIETGSFASSYLKSNSGSSTTRSADSCSVDLSDINFIGGEVTLVADTNTSAIDDYRQAASLIDDSQNQVTIYGNSYNNRLAAILGGGESSTLSQTSANGISALSFGVNDIAATRNGASPVTDTSQSFPDVSAGNLKIGGSGSSQILNGTVKRVTLFNVALSDVELQSLTSS